MAEDFNLVVSYVPKLFEGWSGSGCHTTYSTATMRNGVEGMAYIEQTLKRLEKKHELHMRFYGVDN